MNSHDVLFMHSLEHYYDVYCPCCSTISEINTTITLSWSYTQVFLSRLYIIPYIFDQWNRKAIKVIALIQWEEWKPSLSLWQHLKSQNVEAVNVIAYLFYQFQIFAHYTLIGIITIVDLIIAIIHQTMTILFQSLPQTNSDQN